MLLKKLAIHLHQKKKETQKVNALDNTTPKVEDVQVNVEQYEIARL